jgi:PadR family transcriptional regulator, regulatory protein AphA
VEHSDQAYAVMTILALLGPSTAYDVERFLERLTGEYWSAPHTQVYRECAQLVGAGLVSEKQEKGGRRRRTYALTAKGRRTIRDWIRTPTSRSIEIRDVANLKLLATELSTTEDVRRLAEAQVAAYDERLAKLAAIEQRFTDPSLLLRMQNVRMGRAVYEAARTFWAGIAENPPDVPEAVRSPGT